MKLVIAGSRELHETVPYFQKSLDEMVARFEKDYGKVTMIVSGMARGPDRLGVNYAKANRLHLAEFPAQWDLHGRAAGPIRNAEMAEFADGGVIMWDGKSNGTKHMADCLRKLSKPFIIDIFEPVYYNVEHMPNGKIQVGFHNPLKDL